MEAPAVGGVSSWEWVVGMVAALVTQWGVPAWAGRCVKVLRFSTTRQPVAQDPVIPFNSALRPFMSALGVVSVALMSSPHCGDVVFQGLECCYAHTEQGNDQG